MIIGNNIKRVLKNEYNDSSKMYSLLESLSTINNLEKRISRFEGLNMRHGDILEVFGLFVEKLGFF